MFKREIRVKLEKPDKKQQPLIQNDYLETLNEKVKLFTRQLEGTVVRVGIMLCSYVALDTVRQVLVEREKHRTR